MSDCIEWTGARSSNGYGRHGKRYAHRMAWEQAHGPIPDGLVVRHSCDNPPCVNVEHLLLGTQADNVEDARARRRMYNQKKETCPRGHTYDRVWHTQGRKPIRYCATCRSVQRRAQYAERKAARV